MKIAWIVTIAILIAVVNGQDALPRLQIYNDPNSPTNRRYLAKEGNIPFFWTGDTPWELFNVLSVEDAAYYLDDRQKKGYNILQIVGAWDLQSKNYYGQYPFNPPLDVSNPNEAYWSNVDKVMDMIQERGFYAAIWPVWGSKWVSYWGENLPPTVQAFDPTQAYNFGLWLGTRFRARTNVVWVMGGDIYIPVKPASQIFAYRYMVEGLAQGVLGGSRPHWNDSSDPAWQKILFSLHTGSGQSSSFEFEGDAWLGFNLIQSGWRNWQKIVPLIRNDYELKPTRPTFMGEGAYEWDLYTYCNMPNNTNDQWGVRFNSYWSVFAGGFGTTYGAYGIFQFSPNWKQDLQFPGASQIQYLRKLYEAHQWTKLVPDIDNTFVPVSSSGNTTDCALVIGTYAYDGSFGFVYNTKGIRFQVNLGKLRGNTIQCSWYNPRNGETVPIGSKSKGLVEFVPSGTPGNENDWVLTLVSM